MEIAPSAQLLATQAVACLKRGEDATEAAEKLALYRQGLDLGRRALAVECHAEASTVFHGNSS
jgi:hypothetical protein